MNRFVEQQWSMFEGTQGMRAELMDTLTDADLSFTPGGANITLGALCREMGEVERAYLDSLKTFKHTWEVEKAEPGIETSVARLKAWYAALEREMQATLTAMSDDDTQKLIERSGYPMPFEMQMQAYLQALLIFFAKVTIYLKAMNKPLTPKLRDWIW